MLSVFRILLFVYLISIPTNQNLVEDQLFWIHEKTGYSTESAPSINRATKLGWWIFSKSLGKDPKYLKGIYELENRNIILSSDASEIILVHELVHHFQAKEVTTKCIRYTLEEEAWRVSLLWAKEHGLDSAKLEFEWELNNTIKKKVCNK